MVCLNVTRNVGRPLYKGMEASPSRVPTSTSLWIWLKVIVCLYWRSVFEFVFSVFLLFIKKRCQSPAAIMISEICLSTAEHASPLEANFSNSGSCAASASSASHMLGLRLWLWFSAALPLWPNGRSNYRSLFAGSALPAHPARANLATSKMSAYDLYSIVLAHKCASTLSKRLVRQPFFL